MHSFVFYILCVIIAPLAITQLIAAWRASKRQISPTTPSLGRPLLAAGLLGFTVSALATPWLLEDEKNLFFVGISLVVLTIIFAWWVSLSQDKRRALNAAFRSRHLEILAFLMAASGGRA